MHTLQVHYGAIAEPIEQQLASQGLKSSKVTFWQKCADSITLLHLQSIITDGEAHKARQRLNNMIAKSVTHTNQEEKEL